MPFRMRKTLLLSLPLWYLWALALAGCQSAGPGALSHARDNHSPYVEMQLYRDALARSPGEAAAAGEQFLAAAREYLKTLTSEIDTLRKSSGSPENPLADMGKLNDIDNRLSSVRMRIDAYRKTLDQTRDSFARGSTLRDGTDRLLAETDSRIAGIRDMERSISTQRQKLIGTAREGEKNLYSLSSREEYPEMVRQASRLVSLGIDSPRFRKMANAVSLAEDGQKLLGNGDEEGALNRYREARSAWTFPIFDTVISRTCMSLANRHYDQASDLFSRAANRNPDLLRSAIDEFRKACTYVPNFQDSLQRISDASGSLSRLHLEKARKYETVMLWANAALERKQAMTWMGAADARNQEDSLARDVEKMHQTLAPRVVLYALDQIPDLAPETSRMQSALEKALSSSSLLKDRCRFLKPMQCAAVLDKLQKSGFDFAALDPEERDTFDMAIPFSLLSRTTEGPLKDATDMSKSVVVRQHQERNPEYDTWQDNLRDAQSELDSARARAASLTGNAKTIATVAVGVQEAAVLVIKLREPPRMMTVDDYDDALWTETRWSQSASVEGEFRILRCRINGETATIDAPFSKITSDNCLEIRPGKYADKAGIKAQARKLVSMGDLKQQNWDQCVTDQAKAMETRIRKTIVETLQERLAFYMQENTDQAIEYLVFLHMEFPDVLGDKEFGKTFQSLKKSYVPL